ncbi:uncharacterized protein IWZ02DRAFT_318646 [Phyllosticta citriasiana]|uniref:uncharacterized protein n=1 Tax=Phyllosticta citriasiana TaxID=595635 RepID=UPI0030FD2C2F
MRISSVSANSAILLLSFTTIVCGTGCDCPRGINHVQNQLQNLCGDKTCTWCGDVNGDAYDSIRAIAMGGRSAIRLKGLTPTVIAKPTTQIVENTSATVKEMPMGVFGFYRSFLSRVGRFPGQGQDGGVELHMLGLTKQIQRLTNCLRGLSSSTANFVKSGSVTWKLGQRKVVELGAGCGGEFSLAPVPVDP